MTKNEELSHIDFIKVVMILLIVLYHSCIIYAGGWPGFVAANSSFFLSVFSSWLNTFHIYVFTFASGYLFYYLKYETSKYGDDRLVIKKKCRRLLVPYICVSILWVIPFNIAVYGSSVSEILHKYLLGEAPSQLWFLLMLFDVFVIFIIVSNKINFSLISKKVTILLLLTLFCINLSTLVISYIGIPNIFQLITALKYLLFFFIGMMFRKMNFTKLYLWPYASLALAIDIILFCIYYHLTVLGGFFKLFELILYPLINVSGILMVVLICGTSAAFFDGHTLVKKLNPYTFGIYLFHQQIIYLTLLCFNRPGIPPILVAALNFSISLIISYGIVWILNRYRLTRYLLGK